MDRRRASGSNKRAMADAFRSSGREGEEKAWGLSRLISVEFF